MFNLYNTYIGEYFNIIAGAEILNDDSYLIPYFTTTSFFWFKNEDYLIMIGYLIFTISVCLSVLKLIYDINLKFQIAIHIPCLFYEIVNIMVVVFVVFL